MSTKECLSQYFRAKSNWRTATARYDKPWERHNEIHAASLVVVASFVDSLSDDDPIFATLEDYPYPDEGSAGTQSHTAAIHCGNRYKVIKPEECRNWLEYWIQVYIDECKTTERCEIPPM